MARKKLGIGTWAYMFGPYAENPIDLETTLAELEKIGFDAISVSGFAPHVFVDEWESDEKVAELKALLDKYHLDVAEFSPDPCGINPVVDPEPYIERMKRNVLFLEKCGFTMLRLDTACPPILPESIDYQTAYDRTVYVFKQITEFAKAHNVLIVWEFEPGFIFNKPSEICAIVDDVNDDNFTVLFDACHAHMCATVAARQMGEKEVLEGGAMELLHKLAGKIGMVHMIDSDETLHDDDTSTHAPFGDGVLDMEAIYTELMKPEIYAGDYISIDLCFWADAWNVTQRCYDYVKALQDKIEGAE